VTIRRLLPPLAWTALIAWFSAASWSASETGLLLLPVLRALAPWAAAEQLAAAHWLIRKTAHVVEYAVLAGLWRRTLAAPGSPGGWGALGLSVLTAALDEAHQSTTLTRTGSVADVVLDASGAAAALAALARGWPALDRLIGALLWTAAAGGGALIAIGWTTAAPSGWLWLSVPAAVIALFAWRRRRSRA
jgi:VanZ family protein